MFEPERLPPRGEDGYVLHPDVPDLEDESWAALKEACAKLGWDADYVHGDEIVDKDTGDYDAREWQPEPPAGRSNRPWTLVAIYDTEDGPCAMFVRPKAKLRRRPEMPS